MDPESDLRNPVHAMPRATLILTLSVSNLGQQKKSFQELAAQRFNNKTQPLRPGPSFHGASIQLLHTQLVELDNAHTNLGPVSQLAPWQCNQAVRARAIYDGASDSGQKITTRIMRTRTRILNLKEG